MAKLQKKNDIDNSKVILFRKKRYLLIVCLKNMQKKYQKCTNSPFETWKTEEACCMP